MVTGTNSYQCNHTPLVCPGSDNCTIAYCDPPPGQNKCLTKPVNCDDNNSCTADSCVLSIGCVHTNLCVGDICQDSASVANSCLYFPKGCAINNPGGVNCWTAACDLVNGCTTTQRTDNQAACAFLLLPPATQAGILSGGVIAAIVIAIVVALLISIFGAKKGYDYWKKQQNKMGVVQSNPLYDEALKTGENPLYQ